MTKCVYLGISPQHKGHKCLAPSGRVYVSKDVLFNECRFPYPFLFPSFTTNSSSSPDSTFSASIPTPILPPLAPIPLNQYPPPTSPSPNLSPIVVPTSPSTTSPSGPAGSVQPGLSSSPSGHTESSSSMSKPAPNSLPLSIHPKLTRSKTGCLPPRLFLAHIEPASIKLALSSPQWLAAINETWSLVPFPPNRKAIGCKWVFPVKENSDGTVNKY